MVETLWVAKGAWEGILPTTAFGREGEAGVIVKPREGLVITSLVSSAKEQAALVKVIKKQFGLALPEQGKALVKKDVALLWTAPFQYLLLADAVTSEARDALGSVTAVSDQSDGRAVLRLSGAKVRQTLAKGCMLDLEDQAFPVGAVASTSIAHMGVQIWRVDASHYDLLVARSMAGSFWSWLQGSAAEFGGRIEA